MSTRTSINTFNPFHHILRVDKEETRAHFWRVTVMRYKHDFIKIFSDSTYGGKEEALQAAVVFRDELISKTDTYTQQMWIRNIVRSDNKSGVTGVHRIESHSSKRRRICWCAAWTDEHGKSHIRKFSIMLHGEDKAKELAIAERERQLERICRIKGSHWNDPLIRKPQKIKI